MQTPVGGHHVAVTRYPRGGAPEVRLRFDPDAVGVVVERGPDQSIVRWRNGNETCVANGWITELGSEAGGPLVPDGRTTAPQQATGPVTAGLLPKPRKEPDALSVRVSEHCGTDAAVLERFARANGCWDDSYAALPNFGLRRMSVVNRLRAMVRRGHEVKWE